LIIWHDILFYESSAVFALLPDEKKLQFQAGGGRNPANGETQISYTFPALPPGEQLNYGYLFQKYRIGHQATGMADPHCFPDHSMAPQTKRINHFLQPGFWLISAVRDAGNFFPLQIAGDFVNAMRQKSSWITDINLIPFYLPNGYLENKDLIQFAFVQFASNILLTMPFGFGVNFVARLRRRDFLWVPFAVGFGIELSQLVINWILGYPYRVVDITDALLNAVGVLIGYGFFRLFSTVYIAVSSSIHKEPRGLFAYIHEVASRG
jgi:glycopeptide antibiotics resistance protein